MEHSSLARNGSPGADTLVRRIVPVLLIATAAAICIPYFIALWSLDETGRSAFSNTVPYWDFSNLWGGSWLVRNGETAALFDLARYRAGLSGLFGLPFSAQEWSYPPTILLVGVPLSILPVGVAYAIWTAGSIGAYASSLRLLELDRRAYFLALVCPAIMINALLGQNGALTAALLIGGLALAERKPIMAGILIGALCIKPHLALLMPIVFIASKNWRAFWSAAATVVVMAAASALLFGVEVWKGFFEFTSPLMTSILEAPFGNGYQANGSSAFLLARSLGASLSVAYVVQAVVIAGAALLVWMIWRRPNADRITAIAATLILNAYALPYGYSYDLVVLTAGAAVIMQRHPQVFAAAAVAWIWPAFANNVSGAFLPVAPLVLAPLVVVACRLALGRSQKAEAQAV